MKKPWQAYLDDPQEEIILPWIRGRKIQSWGRQWTCRGSLPSEPGWYRWQKSGGKKTSLVSPDPADPDLDALHEKVSGPLVGDCIIPDSSREPERVFLLEEGLDPFARISAGRAWPQGPLIFISMEMPIGVEDEVQVAFEDRCPNLDHLRGVTPALRAAFALESRRRLDLERAREARERALREELERQAREAREAQERQEREALRAELLSRGALAEVWREMAAAGDFESAAKGALEFGGAIYLSSRRAHRGERCVRYKVGDHRIECICDEKTLQVLDSGICLTDERTGEEFDHLLSLESLPSVVREAIDTHRLVIYRRG